MAKLVLAILPENLAAAALDALVRGGYRVTRISSTGGLLRRGYATLLVGVREEQVEDVIASLKRACAGAARERRGRDAGPPEEPPHCGVTLFVLDVEAIESL
ncbi:MAG: cyclic-di-AMP receptor [Anaerolineae bacterium]